MFNDWIFKGYYFKDIMTRSWSLCSGRLASWHHISFISDCISARSWWRKQPSVTFKIVTTNRPPHRCGFESRQVLWILSCEEDIQLAYGTSVVPLRCPFVPGIMHGRAPKVFFHRLSWNVAKRPILCRCDVKPKTNKNQQQAIFAQLIHNGEQQPSINAILPLLN
jgi:hypothetical protein